MIMEKYVTNDEMCVYKESHSGSAIYILSTINNDIVIRV